MLGTAARRAEKIEALKKSLRQIAPTALVPEPPVELLAQAFDVSAMVGKLCEIAGAPSSGKTSFALGLMRDAQTSRAGALTAFIDGRGQFFPPAAAALGVDLDRLLWIRPGHKLTSVARATEILIRSRAFALIAIDVPVGAQLGRPITARLRTSASQTGTALIVLCNRAGDVEGAHTRLQISAHVATSRPDDTARAATILVHKGSASGGPGTSPLALVRRRGDSAPADPVAPAIERTSPGVEPPGARCPNPGGVDAGLPDAHVAAVFQNRAS